jgi:rod shape determining protein RodA
MSGGLVVSAETPLFRKFLGMNWLLLLTMLALVVGGVYVIYTATHFRTDQPEIMVMWRKQIQWAALGLLGYIIVALVDYRWLKWGAFPAFVIGVAGLVAVQVFGEEINHNKSWIRLPGLGTVQPSQFAIASGIIMLSFALGELHRIKALAPIFKHHFLRLIFAAGCTAIPLAFVLKEGDMGSALVWVPVFGAMLLAGNIPFRYLIVIALAGLMVLPPAYYFGLKRYQRERIEVQIKMLKGEKVDYQKEGYASMNVVRAIGSAGLEGKGVDGERLTIDPKTGEQKKTMHHMGLIPRHTAHNDYIFAVFAEQFGFKGCLLLIGVFSLLIFQTIYVAFCARDQVGRLLVIGVAALLFAHTFQSIGMQVQLMPITGIPLPFISYGGTFVMTTMILLGLVQSVWVHRNVAVEEAPKPQRDARSFRPGGQGNPGGMLRGMVS